MLKVKLESLDGLDESLHSFYKKQDDGSFALQVDGLEDTGALKRAKEHEKEQRKAAEAKARELEERLEALESEGSRKKGDVEAIDKSWKAKYDKLQSEMQAQVDAAKGQIRKLRVDNVAQEMAAALSIEGSAKVLLPHIQSRLDMEERDGEFVTVVKDAQGKASALSLDELREEFANDKAFAHIIVGSKASGGGASGGQGGGAAKKTVTRSEFNAMSPDKQMAFSKENGTVTD